uniref:NepYr protein n=1 Tax=Fopius arisanus TaxID=64838 RepID=A0A0C9QZ06_9HYME
MMMIKMMMTVVIAFTICWLPFNVLTLVLDNNESINSWRGLPFAWTALHWLSMSHSCYNPVIYCWMSGKFRLGFIKALGRIPGLRKLLPDRRLAAYNTSTAGVPLTGFDGANCTGLRRMNTCTTYVSVRRKTDVCHGMPVRSASFRHCEPARSNQHRIFMKLEGQAEDQI